jgi:phytoene synthase
MRSPATDMNHPSLASHRDIIACREHLRGGSHSFFAASLVLPRRVAAPATALYAFCREADDAIDLGSDHVAALNRLHERLDRIYAADPEPHAVDRAFAAVVTGTGLPRALPEALLEGFAWDAEGRRYRDLDALYAYAARVAGTVGAMMAVLMGVRDRVLLARACDLGTAMQLTNIARDVGEDARAGRVYLPLEWLTEAGIDVDDWLANPRYTPALGGLVERLIRTAEPLYARASSGIDALPPGCRPGMHAARLLYREIGWVVAANGFDSVTTRATTSTRRKLARVADALAAASRPGPVDPDPPLAQVEFLVEAATHAAPHAADDTIGMTDPELPWWDLGTRWALALELFSRLDERQPLSNERSAQLDGQSATECSG